MESQRILKFLTLGNQPWFNYGGKIVVIVHTSWLYLTIIKVKKINLINK